MTMVNYDISSLDSNKTILETLHDIQKYLKANPIYKVYYANGSYAIGQAQYNLTLIGNNQGAIAEGDVVFFNNNYYAKVSSVGSTTFSVFPAVAVQGSGGAQIKTMSQLEFLNILSVLYDNTEGAHINLTGKTEYTDGTETSNSMELLVPIVPKDSSIEISASSDNEHVQVALNKRVISNPNLIINPDFAINQRGESSYSANNKYSVDRWKVVGNNTTVTPLDFSGITLANITGGGSCQQIIENGFNMLKGQKVTISANINGTLYITNGTIPSSLPENAWNISVGGTTVFGLSLSTTGVLTIYISVGSGITSKINWVKLEVGGYATEFVPPLIAEELPKCQRYYEELNNDIVQSGRAYAIGGIRSEHESRYYIEFKQVKRTLPTITYSDYNTFIVFNYVSQIDITEIATIASNKDGAMIRANGLSLGNMGSACQLNSKGTSNAKICVDAEIY